MMSSTTLERLRFVHDPWLIGLAGLVVSLVGALLLLPGDLAAKAHIALHGLCAQRLSHTFLLGGTPLPFDARMTGIYLGVLIAVGPLLSRRRGVTIGWPWLILLLAFVTMMGMDGLNSLRVDLGLPAWWIPDNRLRLGTGLVAGLSLGVALTWLLNSALWAERGNLVRARDGIVWLIGMVVVGLVVLSGPGWAFAPVTLLLLLGATVALTMLNLAVAGMILPSLVDRGPSTAREGSNRRGLARPITLALGLAIIEMAALAGFRFALEAMIGQARL